MGFVMRNYGLVAAGAMVTAGLIALAIVIGLRSDDTPPITWGNPYPLLQDRVTQGTFVTTNSTTCNKTDRDIAMVTFPSWQRVDGVVERITGDPVDVVFPPGCVLTAIDLPLPPELGPGRWIRIGRATYEIDGLLHVDPFFSESFEVVE